MFQTSQIIIVGAGPAGIACALQAADKCKDILILEGGETPLKKFLLTGGGKCNLTHDGNVNELLSHYYEKKRFLSCALHTFPPQKLLSFFKDRGLDFYTDTGGCIFPVTNQAGDIAHLLLQECSKKNIIIKCREKVTEIFSGENIFSVTASRSRYKARKLVIACGGKSFPQTGSDGSIFPLLERLGHKIIGLAPALCGLTVKKFSSLSGITVKNAIISTDYSGKKRFSVRGELLFTHNGISGPAVLNISRYAVSSNKITVNFIPEFNTETCTRSLQKESAVHGKWKIGNLTAEVFRLPVRLCRLLCTDAGLNPDIQSAHVSSDQKKKLAAVFTACELSVQAGSINNAMASRGGVCISMIDQSAMQSTVINNLYFAGECMDIDGECGGYNLQAAFSTGFLAGEKLSDKN